MIIRLNTKVRYLTIAKIFAVVLMIYISWYREVWGDRPIMLYGATAILALIVVFDIIKYRIRFYSNRFCSPGVKMFFIYGAYALLTSMIIAGNRSLALESLVTYFAYLLVCFCMYYICYIEESFDFIFKGLILCGIICAIQTVFFGVPFYNGVMVTTMSSTNNPNALGFVMVFAVFSIITLYRKTSKHIFITLFLLLLFSYVTVLTGSRKSFVFVALFLVVWALSILIFEKKEGTLIKQIGIIIIIIIGVCLIVYYVNNYLSTTAMFTRLTNLVKNQGQESRTLHYAYAFQYWKESPIFGIGFNQYRVLSPLQTYSHSSYAEILCCSGIIGIMIVFIPIVHTLVALIRHYFVKKSNSTMRLDIAILIMLAFMELVCGLSIIYIYDFFQMIIICYVLSYKKVIDAENSAIK